MKNLIRTTKEKNEPVPADLCLKIESEDSLLAATKCKGPSSRAVIISKR